MQHSSSLNGQPHSHRLVIGGNRGIGLALVEAQLDKPEISTVIATHRPSADLSGQLGDSLR